VAVNAEAVHLGINCNRIQQVERAANSRLSSFLGGGNTLGVNTVPSAASFAKDRFDRMSVDMTVLGPASASASLGLVLVGHKSPFRDFDLTD